jgi:hypothetical protein
LTCRTIGIGPADTSVVFGTDLGGTGNCSALFVVDTSNTTLFSVFGLNTAVRTLFTNRFGGVDLSPTIGQTT